MDWAITTTNWSLAILAVFMLLSADTANGYAMVGLLAVVWACIVGPMYLIRHLLEARRLLNARAMGDLLNDGFQGTPEGLSTKVKNREFAKSRGATSMQSGDVGTAREVTREKIDLVSKLIWVMFFLSFAFIVAVVLFGDVMFG